MSKYFIYKGRYFKVYVIGYGHYEVVSKYRNQLCTFRTHDSELYDYCDDDSNIRRMYMYQRRCLEDIRHVYFSTK